MHSDTLGWAAAALMVATFSCHDARRLRPLAVATNLAFIGYGLMAHLLPVLALHLLLLPINLWRWAQALGWDVRQMGALAGRCGQALCTFGLACLPLVAGGSGGGNSAPPELPPSSPPEEIAARPGTALASRPAASPGCGAPVDRGKVRQRRHVAR